MVFELEERSGCAVIKPRSDGSSLVVAVDSLVEEHYIFLGKEYFLWWGRGDCVFGKNNS